MNSDQAVIEPYRTLHQQRTAMVQGMWIFLATELLLFAGGFTAYLVYRVQYADAFAAASPRLDLMLGSFNTAILLTSSCTMALADHAARRSRRATAWLLMSTAALGVVFLAIKGIEYRNEYHEGLVPFLNRSFHEQGPASGHAGLFFNLYFVMTGLHAVHLTAGIALVGFLLLQVRYQSSEDILVSRVMVGALYWHFIDIVWVFLFPMFYLVR